MPLPCTLKRKKNLGRNETILVHSFVASRNGVHVVYQDKENIFRSELLSDVDIESGMRVVPGDGKGQPLIVTPGRTH